MQTLNVTGTGRYVRMYGTARATAYGYSLWEFQVYGTTGAGSGVRHHQRRAGPAGDRVLHGERRRSAASAAVDGNTGTRWSSAFSDPQWLQVDLGATPDHLPGRAALGGRVRQGVPDPDLDRRHQLDDDLLAPPPAPAASRPSTSPAPAATSACTARPAAPRTATRCGSSASTRPAAATAAADRRRPRRRPAAPAASGAPPASFWGTREQHPGGAQRAGSEDPQPDQRPVPRQPGLLELQRPDRVDRQQPYIDMPANSAGRMYFYLGSPNGQYYDFIEFTVGASSINVRHHPGRPVRPEAGAAAARPRRLRPGGRRELRHLPGESDGDVPAVPELGADRVQGAGDRPGAVRHPVAGQRPGIPAGRRSTRTT